MEWRWWSHCCLARLSPGSGNPIRRIFLFYRSCLTNSRNYTYCSNVEYSNAKFFLGILLITVGPPLEPLTSNSSTRFDGRIQPPSARLVDRGPMQNLAYSLWTRPGPGPLPIGRIGESAIFSRSSWRIFSVSADRLAFQYSRGQ
jgi:hypothetical protein